MIPHFFHFGRSELGTGGAGRSLPICARCEAICGGMGVASGALHPGHRCRTWVPMLCAPSVSGKSGFFEGGPLTVAEWSVNKKSTKKKKRLDENGIGTYFQLTER